MVRVTVWLQLLLVVLILRQSAAVSDQCSQLQEEISRLERDILNITELKHKNELRADNCTEHLTKQILILQARDRNLTQSEAVISGLKKQLDEYKTKLETKEEVLKNNNETQIQLQTDIDGLTKTLKSLNQTVQGLHQKQKYVCQDLIKAVISVDYITAKILVKYNNDDCTDNDVYRYTPLIYAAMNGHWAIVLVLLDGGVKVDGADAYGRTALHKAALIGRVDICRLLLDRGAKVDHLDMEHYTPLLHAAEGGHLSVVILLVERGADIRVKNDDGRTASDLARSKGKIHVSVWLDSKTRG